MVFNIKFQKALLKDFLDFGAKHKGNLCHDLCDTLLRDFLDFGAKEEGNLCPNQCDTLLRDFLVFGANLKFCISFYAKGQKRSAICGRPRANNFLLRLFQA